MDGVQAALSSHHVYLVVVGDLHQLGRAAFSARVMVGSAVYDYMKTDMNLRLFSSDSCVTSPYTFFRALSLSPPPHSVPRLLSYFLSDSRYRGGRKQQGVTGNVDDSLTRQPPPLSRRGSEKFRQTTGT